MWKAGLTFLYKGAVRTANNLCTEAGCGAYQKPISDFRGQDGRWYHVAHFAGPVPKKFGREEWWGKLIYEQIERLYDKKRENISNLIKK